MEWSAASPMRFSKGSARRAELVIPQPARRGDRAHAAAADSAAASRESRRVRVFWHDEPARSDFLCY
jgi:hypothetical protein